MTNHGRWRNFPIFLRDTLLNSYAMLFFSNDRPFAVAVMLLSFLNPYAGVGGLVALVVGITSTRLIGFSAEQVRSGLYTYGTLLTGLGMGTFYEWSTGYWILLALAALFSVIVSAVFIARMGRFGLPALSLGFIATLWLVILSAGAFSSIGLTERNIYWLNEMYAVGGSDVLRFVERFESLEIPRFLSGFFRSMSAIIFQNNMLTGLLLTLALLRVSRISLMLMILGFGVSMTFIEVMGGMTSGVNYYNLGTNFMLVSLALGGFYVIPSARSFLWAALMVPVSYLLVVGLWKITAAWGLPVFSLPFCVTVLLFLRALQIAGADDRMLLTPIQYFQPEENLYRYRSGRERRLHHKTLIPIRLPLMGTWYVSQGYDGAFTHRDAWRHALDFVITDKEGNAHRNQASVPADHYCFDKPVLAPADGQVEYVTDHVEDNPLGHNNTRDNWGNTVIIRHAEGLYSKLSHLRRGSIRVKKGDHLRQGDIIGLCGNSGRSPLPHLHFQLQTTAWLSAGTLPYPLAAFLKHNGDGYTLIEHSVPSEGDLVCNVSTQPEMVQAFSFQPGMAWTVRAGDISERWEVEVSPWNESYIHCRELGVRAYFISNGIVFSFTQCYGDRKSLLHQFSVMAGKVLLSTEHQVKVRDTLPIPVIAPGPIRWLQDLVSPFRIFLKMEYQSVVRAADMLSIGRELVIDVSTRIKYPGSSGKDMSGSITLKDGRLTGFRITDNGISKDVICEY
jgi:urea transporter/murein DD-endopeptidase MepM/ murein hydrolase activator NlpD